MIQNINQLLFNSQRKYGAHIAFEQLSGSELSAKTFCDVVHDVNIIAGIIRSFGLSNANIAVVGENSYEWVVSFLGIVCSGNVCVPFDKEMSDEDLIQLSELSDIEAVFYSKSFETTAMKWVESSKIKICVCFSFPRCVSAKIYAMPQLMATFSVSSSDLYLADEVKPSQRATIFYSSGTTGANKGIILTHYQICANVVGATSNMKLKNGPSLSILPLHHCFELCVDILGSMYLGNKVCICNRLRNLRRDLRLFAPQRICMVPAIMQSMWQSICWPEIAKCGVAEGVSISNKLSNSILLNDSLWREQIKSAFGGRFPQLIIGGAACRPNTVFNLSKIGFQIMFGYGMTEVAGFISMNFDAGNNPNSVGKVFDYLELTISNPDQNGIGEILIKGSSVTSGYYKDMEATNHSFVGDGWLKTGDLGYLDGNKDLYLTGRKKSTIILENGENVTPEELEESIISNIDYVLEVIVCPILDKKTNNLSISAVIFVDSKSFDNIPAIIEDLKEFNKRLPPYKKIRYAIFKPKEFAKTSALKKIKRNQVAKEIENEVVYSIG